MIQITFLGQCGFVLNCDGIIITIDPYLSDYLDRELSNDEVHWIRKFLVPTTLSQLHPDIVLISHRHEDHLDPWTIQPYISNGGEAVFIAPHAAKTGLQKMGVKHIKYLNADEDLVLDGIYIKAIACAHPVLHQDDNGNFVELSYIIQYDNHTFFFGGDMMIREGLVDQILPYECDVMMLPCNGRDEWRNAHAIIGNTTSAEAAEFARNVHAKSFIPMHHDLYEINACSNEQIQKDAAVCGIKCFCMTPMQTLNLDEMLNKNVQGLEE